MKQKTYRLCLFSMIVIVLVVGLLCYDRAGKQAQEYGRCRAGDGGIDEQSDDLY